MPLPVVQASQYITRVAYDLDHPEPRNSPCSEQYIRQSIANLFESPDGPGNLEGRLGKQGLDQSTTGTINRGTLRRQVRYEPVITARGQLISGDHSIMFGPEPKSLNGCQYGPQLPGVLFPNHHARMEHSSR